jgi:hypothetical protein
MPRGRAAKPAAAATPPLFNPRAPQWARVEALAAADEAGAEAAFQQAWACKEAFVKARGDGLGFAPLSRIHTELRPAADLGAGGNAAAGAPGGWEADLTVDGAPLGAGWHVAVQRLPRRHWVAVVRAPPSAAVDEWGVRRRRRAGAGPARHATHALPPSSPARWCPPRSQALLPSPSTPRPAAPPPGVHINAASACPRPRSRRRRARRAAAGVRAAHGRRPAAARRGARVRGALRRMSSPAPLVGFRLPAACQCRPCRPSSCSRLANESERTFTASFLSCSVLLLVSLPCAQPCWARCDAGQPFGRFRLAKPKTLGLGRQRCPTANARC